MLSLQLSLVLILGTDGPTAKLAGVSEASYSLASY